MKSGRTPNVIEKKAAEIANPAMIAIPRLRAIGFGRGCDA
jgi:hypothetical protein